MKWWVTLGGRTPHVEQHARPFSDEDEAAWAFEFARFAVGPRHTWAALIAPGGVVERVVHHDPR